MCSCVGESFAYLQLSVIISYIVRNYTLKLVGKDVPQANFTVSCFLSCEAPETNIADYDRSASERYRDLHTSQADRLKPLSERQDPSETLHDFRWTNIVDRYPSLRTAETVIMHLAYPVTLTPFLTSLLMLILYTWALPYNSNVHSLMDRCGVIMPHRRFVFVSTIPYLSAYISLFSSRNHMTNYHRGA